MTPHAWHAGKTGIAAAVARAIDNGVHEGYAYKAEWDRRGSDSGKHIAAAVRDALTMARCEETHTRLIYTGTDRGLF